MIIYEEGEVRDVDCKIYEPFPEPKKEETEEPSQELLTL